MRKLMYFLIFLLAIQITASAQDVRGGFRAGVAISRYLAVGNNVRTRYGPDLGIVWNVSGGKNFSFQPAFNFWLQKGYDQTKTILNSTTTIVSLKANLFEAQFNFVYNTAGKKGKFFIGAGPSASLAVNGKWTYKSQISTDKLDVSFGKTEKNDLKKNDFGATVTTGYYTSWGFLISFCYNRGFTDLNPHTTGRVIQSNYFGIQTGFLLPFEPKKK